MAIIVFFNIHSHRKPENVKKMLLNQCCLKTSLFVFYLLLEHLHDLEYVANLNVESFVWQIELLGFKLLCSGCPCREPRLSYRVPISWLQPEPSPSNFGYLGHEATDSRNFTFLFLFLLCCHSVSQPLKPLTLRWMCLASHWSCQLGCLHATLEYVGL